MQVRSLSGEEVERETLLGVGIGRIVEFVQVVSRIRAGAPLVIACIGRFVRLGGVRAEKPFTLGRSFESGRIGHQRRSHGCSVVLLVEVVEVNSQQIAGQTFPLYESRFSVGSVGHRFASALDEGYLFNLDTGHHRFDRNGAGKRIYVLVVHILYVHVECRQRPCPGKKHFGTLLLAVSGRNGHFVAHPAGNVSFRSFFIIAVNGQVGGFGSHIRNEESHIGQLVPIRIGCQVFVDLYFFQNRTRRVRYENGDVVYVGRLRKRIHRAGRFRLDAAHGDYDVLLSGGSGRAARVGVFGTRGKYA